MSEVTVEDILRLRDAMDDNNVPEYGRVAAITDENGTVIMSGKEFNSQCWTVTKR